MPHPAERAEARETFCSKLDSANRAVSSREIRTRNGLVAFPAQCNFSGYKYPLTWVEDIQRGNLVHLLTPQYDINQSEKNAGEEINQSAEAVGDGPPRTRWFVLLDAAAFVSTNYLDLAKFQPDFITISFYKMFGFPTGESTG